jgi:hypothetical protein
LIFEVHSFSQTIKALFVSLLFAVFFALMPWQDIQGGAFIDRQVYFDIFSSESSIIIPLEWSTLIPFILNEQLWSITVRWLNNSMHISLTVIFSVITFMVVFSYSYFVACRVGTIAVLLLLNPLLVDLAYSQLRISLAMVFLLAAYNIKNALIAGIFILVACFIHTASLLFVFMAGLVFYCIRLTGRYDLGRVASYLSFVGIGFLIAVMVGPLRTWILEYFGDRRVSYDALPTSWVYASIWVFILCLASIQYSSFFRDRANTIAITFLSVYTFCTLFSVYGLRFLAAALPFFVVALCRFGNIERVLIILVFAAYSVVQWVYWIR